jgi:hypothetical protein
MDKVENPIHAKILKNAPSEIQPKYARGTVRFLPVAAAINAMINAAQRPEVPRANKGGHSCRRNFIAGQFSPHPIDVASKQSKPMERESGMDTFADRV